jgi:hypothetical protein
MKPNLMAAARALHRANDVALRMEDEQRWR